MGGPAIRILILPGDGIGPEIARATRAALDAVNRALSLGLEFVERDIGLKALAAEGTTLPPRVLEEARAADGVVLGPVSTHAYPPAEQGGINPSAAIRKALDLFANIRPARARPGVPAKAPDIDLVIVRENTEGFYADRNMAFGSGELQPTDDVALSVRKITAAGSRRVAEAAFELARRRRKRVAAVHKANVLKLTDGLFLREVREAAKRFPDVALEDFHVDAMAALLVRKPAAFDVVLATNMFGDILSDEAGELAGGLGLAGALNAGAAHAIAQSVHGSAPDIEGRGIANPSALMLSSAMLLDWLARRRGGEALAQAAARLEGAVERALADPESRTPDVGGAATTARFGEAVARAIAERDRR
jgi:3-isopropylmalate dehydrogenase